MSVLALSEKVEAPELKRSKFDLSHVHSTTGYMQKLLPIYCEEVVPGDTFKIRISHIIRMLPLAGPLAQRVDLFVHAFFVPNRIVWDGWEEFITGRSASFVPTEDIASVSVVDASRTIGMYYGLPLANNLAHTKYCSRLPLLGYVKIYNDYYRNKIIETPVDPDGIAYFNYVFDRNWSRDYFYSAIPYPQLGNPSNIQMDVSYLDSGIPVDDTGATISSSGYVKTSGSKLYHDVAGKAMNIQNIDEIGVDVNDLRYAYAYQDWLVRMLKSGDEYHDHLLNVFGVKSSDARLQRVEYLGGYSKPVIINDVTQTGEALYWNGSAEVSGNPVGTQAGTGMSYGDSDTIECFCEEHGYIHIIVSMMPKPAHWGGIAKHFSKTVPLDFYFPQFAYLPEQTILNQELYLADDGDYVNNTAVFGYIERYAEYKHRNDVISGKMPKEYDHLHFANIYTEHPTLEDAWLKYPIREDAFAIANDIHFFGQFGFNVEAYRPMPFNVDNTNII